MLTWRPLRWQSVVLLATSSLSFTNDCWLSLFSTSFILSSLSTSIRNLSWTCGFWESTHPLWFCSLTHNHKSMLWYIHLINILLFLFCVEWISFYLVKLFSVYVSLKLPWISQESWLPMKNKWHAQVNFWVWPSSLAIQEGVSVLLTGTVVLLWHCSQPSGLKRHCSPDMTHSLNSPTHMASLQVRSTRDVT